MQNLKDILKLPLFSDLKLINNPNFTDKIIETVDVTETPDVANYTSNNVLILTTGMVFEHDQLLLIPFIESLNKINACGLAIKTSRFLKNIDQRVIDYANSVAFPLIEIPQTRNLGQLVHEMMDYLLQHQFHEIQYALNTQRHFSNLFMKDASVVTIIEELSKLLGVPVLFMNQFHKVIAHSNHFNKTHNPVEPYQNQFAKLVHDKPREVSQSTFKDIKNNVVRANIYPISNNNNNFPHYLIVFNPNDLTYPVSNFTIEQGILILTFTLYKTGQIEDQMIALQSHFFKSIFSDAHQFDTNFYSQALSHGIINSTYYQVIECSPYVEYDDASSLSLINKLVYHWITDFTLPSLKYSLCFFDKSENKVNILLQHNNLDLISILEKCTKQLNDILGIKLKFGLGRPVQHLAMLSDSYFEASKALEIRNDTCVKTFKPSGIMTLFNTKNNQSSQYFIRTHLKSLADTTDSGINDLRDTLRVYLENNCEITSTSNELFLHRNTVIYRIKKCEEILGVNIKDRDTYLNLRLALELHEHI